MTFETWVSRQNEERIIAGDYGAKTTVITVDTIEAFVRALGSLVEDAGSVIPKIRDQPRVKAENIDQLMRRSGFSQPILAYFALCGAALLLKDESFYKFICMSSLSHSIGCKISTHSSLVYYSDRLSVKPSLHDTGPSAAPVFAGDTSATDGTDGDNAGVEDDGDGIDGERLTIFDQCWY